MLLGGITSFPIGKSLKLAGVGFVLAVISMGGYLAYNQYKNLTKHIVELSQDKAELSGENHTLKTIISTQDNNIRFLKDRITARNNRLTQQPPTKVGGFRMLTNRVETIQL
uniref:hypothetical protein n=1 Tax=Xenorhabdus szentirmaii TaxID=290112 RepID=UPI00056E0F91